MDVFKGDEAIADSVNQLLVVGFYLINLGYISLMLKISDPVTDARQGIEALAAKMGLVLLVLGGMHLFNLFLFSRIRASALNNRKPMPVGEAPSARPRCRATRRISERRAAAVSGMTKCRVGTAAG